MAFELQPILKGEILELRPLQEADFPALFGVASDPLIWEQHPVPDRCKLEVFRGFFAGIMKSGGATVAVDLKDGRVIGSSVSTTTMKPNARSRDRRNLPSPVPIGAASTTGR